MTKALALVVILILGLAGCAAPVNSKLWNPRPEVITVVEDLSFEQKAVGRLLVPKGEYRYWYSNKFGHYYQGDAVEIQLDIRTVFGAQKHEQFKGGIWLSNRADAVLIYQLSSVAENSKSSGEVAHLVAWEAGDKDGLARNWKGQLPQDLRSKLRFNWGSPSSVLIRRSAKRDAG